MRKLIRLFLFIFLSIFSFLIQDVSAATTTHLYDSLNRLTQTVYDTGSQVTTVSYTYDPAGNMLSFNIESDHLLGDVDNSETLDLVDVVICLQLAAGVTPSSELYLGADIDGDGKLSVIEAIIILREVAGF